jgi:hypothetical protein
MTGSAPRGICAPWRSRRRTLIPEAGAEILLAALGRETDLADRLRAVSAPRRMWPIGNSFDIDASRMNGMRI